MQGVEDGFEVAQDGGVLRIVFNRPAVRNAFGPHMTGPLAQALTDAQADRAVRCIVFSGAGGHFSSGGDVAGFARTLDDPPAARSAAFRARLTLGRGMIEALVAFDRPIIASLRGGVAGAGLAFPLAADLVLADDTATMAFAHQRMGLTPDGGLSWLLPRAVGLRAARRLMLTAATVQAAAARDLGLIDEIHAPEALEAATAKAAARFAAAPQRAIAGAKRLLEASLSTPLGAQLDAETEALAACVADPDFDEGVTAFLDKRPARFPSAI